MGLRHAGKAPPLSADARMMRSGASPGASAHRGPGHGGSGFRRRSTHWHKVVLVLLAVGLRWMWMI
ncbi:hypothetical protein FH972_023751 [Carpinus fangiana]|uniref:Uncharacterized protein n=1 Tax=Carpinus fangiana TaxID=176857 RepID=A0A5N6KWH9_9ROSI|nr:hypothetical protein FH972_023751 [Carpinus fangiana]